MRVRDESTDLEPGSLRTALADGAPKCLIGPPLDGPGEAPGRSALAPRSASSAWQTPRRPGSRCGAGGRIAFVPGVPRRRLTPAARDVLWELEEAGSEMMATLRRALARHEDLEATIWDLARQGLVEVLGSAGDDDEEIEIVLTDKGWASFDE